MREMVDADESGNVDLPEIMMMLARKMNDNETEKKANQAFKVYDRQNNGEISEDDLRRIMVNLSDKITEQEMEEMVREADEDKNGTIDQEEFIKMLITR